jgi:6-phosphogluconate dehydrogenase
MMNSSESSLRGATAKIGLIGLGVMGQNLALNIERNGFPIAVYDREAPVLAMSSSLGYFDMYRTANLPLNLTQAQRDFFGSHTYERIDRPELGFVHTEWEELLEKQRGQ